MTDEEAKERIIAQLKEKEENGYAGSRNYLILKNALKRFYGIDWDEYKARP